jgi:hypothetical protein
VLAPCLADLRVNVFLAELTVRHVPVKSGHSSKPSSSGRTITGTTRPRILIEAASASTWSESSSGTFPRIAIRSTAIRCRPPLTDLVM